MDPFKIKPRIVKPKGQNDIMWAQRYYRGGPIDAICTCGWMFKHRRDKVVRRAMLNHREKKGHDIHGG